MLRGHHAYLLLPSPFGASGQRFSLINLFSITWSDTSKCFAIIAGLTLPYFVRQFGHLLHRRLLAS
jgi:hypothetical protein